MKVRNIRPWEFTQLRRRMKKSLSKGHKKKEQVRPLLSSLPPGVLVQSSISAGAIQQKKCRGRTPQRHTCSVSATFSAFLSFFSGDRIALSIRAVKDELAYRRSCAVWDSPHFPALISLVQHPRLPRLLLLKSYLCVCVCLFPPNLFLCIKSSWD